MNCSTSAKATISSNLRSISALLHAEDRAVQEDVLAAGQLRGGSRCRPRAASRRGRGRPTRPSVGSVMRDRILSSVLLPAPLRPMMPTTSPCWTSNDTSFSAQSVVVRARAPPRRARRAAAPRRRVASRASAGIAAAAADPVALAEPLGADGDGSSDDVGERALDAAEVESPPTTSDDDDGDGRDEGHPRPGAGPPSERPAEAFDHAGHRVQPVERAPPLGHERRRIGDRRREHPELHGRTARRSARRGTARSARTARARRRAPWRSAEQHEQRAATRSARPARCRTTP